MKIPSLYYLKGVPDVDIVITTNELAKLINDREVRFEATHHNAKYDEPLGAEPAQQSSLERPAASWRLHFGLRLILWQVSRWMQSNIGLSVA
ncbi:hypothetical protein CXIVA_00820 [Clostridium sp. SY8519]|uniref:[Fe-Fe] hydrogenase large subunit C-terminal domain-containing protein n=1 Tax=Clostridium sp. (strain SY8519) TaxID=1042156 RepID=UPI000217166C|nr:[Fe-Fe] hydrogenase large subunit C-terminal domain-containing protein [Clostridium sp. SY8519]BAK46049.1 hypothetical protein CXIVA_00820 [Clostridium sp. SY8519]